MPAGIKIYNEDGSVALEVGGHVLDGMPDHSQLVGQIAAAWAQAEAELGGYLAYLMKTTPERTFALMSAFRSADRTVQGASALAAVAIDDDFKLEAFKKILKRFKILADERNLILHAVWAASPTREGLLIHLKAIDYSMFATQLLACANPDEQVNFARAFVDRAGGYSIDQLGDLKDRLYRLVHDVAAQKTDHMAADAFGVAPPAKP